VIIAVFVLVKAVMVSAFVLGSYSGRRVMILVNYRSFSGVISRESLVQHSDKASSILGLSP
jgi:hypothetical protein